jgi:MoaA/NifB/PqqE/SkfB family radical SAM enzyme
MRRLDMRFRPIAATFLRIAKRLDNLLDRIPYSAGLALRKTRALRTVNQCIARWKNKEKPIDPAGSAPLCVLPWIHTQIETTGEVQLCCLAHNPRGSLGNVHRDSILRIFQSNRINTIRNQMLSGTWPADCADCREREARGLESFRQSSNVEHPALFEKLARGAAPAPAIRSLDLRINNVCNFKCRFCHGWASNRWFNEHNLVFPDNPISEKYHGIDRDQSFWDDFDRDIVRNLETIHLAGGEPLIIDAHYRLLEKLIAAGRTDVYLQYNTNLSHLKFKHWDIIQLWKQFPNLKISLSLDGVGRKGEYIREGLDYEEWVENVRRLQREVPHARRVLHFVVCIFNVIDFPEHFKTIAENQFVEPGWMILTFLNWPAYLSAQVLMPELKCKAERNLRELLSSDFGIVPHTRGQIEALIEFLKAEDLFRTYGKEFAERTRILDRARGQNAAELFPDLALMLKTRPAPLALVNR